MPSHQTLWLEPRGPLHPHLMVMHDYIAMLSAHTWLMPPVFARKAENVPRSRTVRTRDQRSISSWRSLFVKSALGCSQVAPAAGHRPADPIRVFS